MATVPAKPTIVIVPGAWQLAVSYSPFAKQLEALGFPTEVVPLPSVGGTESPLPGLPEDVAAVREALTRFADEGRDILLLCHSYGGVVGSCAVEGFDFASRKKDGKTGGVILVTYMTAFMIPKGKSLLDMLGGAPSPWMHIEGDKCTAVASMMKQIAFNDVSEEETAYNSTLVTHTSAAVFATPSTYEPWANGVQCAYILCSEDNALPYPVQQQMAAQLGPDPITFTLKSGHLPFLSIPGLLLESINRAAEAALAKKGISKV